MKTWNFAVIGCGGIGDFHLQALREIEAAHLIGVSSRREKRAREVGERENCPWTTDYHGLLNKPEIDVVCLTTSSGSHASIGLEVLAAGKHLLVEKPVAMTTDEADQLVRLAKQKNLSLAVVSQQRFEKQHQVIKHVMDEGVLGRLLYVDVACPFSRTQKYYDQADWRGTLSEDGGALMNQGIHTIDLMMWFAGAVQSVSGKVATKIHQMEAEDIGAGLLTFKNGAMGTLMSSTSIQPGFSRHFHLYGENGTIKLEGEDFVHWTVPGVSEPRSNHSNSDGGVVNPLSISTENHKRQIIDMIHSLNDGKSPAVTGEDGKCAVQLVEAIYKSSKVGKEIELSQ